MRKSDSTTTPTTSNVVPFPKQLNVPPTNPRLPLSARSREERQKARRDKIQALLNSPDREAIVAKNRSHFEFITSSGKPTPESVDAAAPRLVRKVLSLVGPDKTLKKSDLSRMYRRQLDLLCEFKHPAALIIRDWLEDNSRLLPNNLETIAKYSSCDPEGGK
ncbi:MAG: hypothetical protein CML31_14140 [Rhizobiales bacterium]|nr:hypothetical protein [Hyphomicrobiales bacterium]|tara:strand:+ start:52190 stop:52675 length:486 start_codon:yes stop_codon:yes gene_type:complete